MQYLDLTKMPNGTLQATWAAGVTDADKADIRHTLETEGFFAAVSELLEYHLGNGWTWLRPEDIGALTGEGNTLLSDTVVTDDAGDILDVETVYYDNDYALRFWPETLLDTGVFTFLGS